MVEGRRVLGTIIQYIVCLFCKMFKHLFLFFICTLEGTVRYVGLLLGPVDCFDLQPRLFYAVVLYFRPFLVFSCNFNNLR